MNLSGTIQYWDSFYKDNYPSDTSSFFKFVSQHVSLDCVVIDVGCGTARDTIAFTTKAAQVIGVDASRIVIERNQANYNHLYSNLAFINLDINDVVQLDDLFSQVKCNYSGKRMFIYCRFFLHAITERAEDTLLTSLGKCMGSNDLILLEFRTKEDESLYKNYDNHFRRYIDTDEFDIKLKTYNLKTEFFVKSRGLSIYKNEDPFLARYVIKKGEANG